MLVMFLVDHTHAPHHTDYCHYSDLWRTRIGTAASGRKKYSAKSRKISIKKISIKKNKEAIALGKRIRNAIASVLRLMLKV